MKDRIFIDTNVFIYAYIANDEQKHSKSVDMFSKEFLFSDVVISPQVINEFYAVSTTKYKFSHFEAMGYATLMIENFFVSNLTKGTVLQAFKLKEKYKYSWWDSLVLSSALENNCSILYTEDMQDGQIIGDNLKIRNPFA